MKVKQRIGAQRKVDCIVPSFIDKTQRFFRDEAKKIFLDFATSFDAL